jgi:hypothetical protein
VTILRGELDVPCDLQEAPWSLLAP